VVVDSRRVVVSGSPMVMPIPSVCTVSLRKRLQARRTRSAARLHPARGSGLFFGQADGDFDGCGVNLARPAKLDRLRNSRFSDVVVTGSGEGSGSSETGLLVFVAVSGSGMPMLMPVHRKTFSSVTSRQLQTHRHPSA
jgi:hypothetical protein